MVYNRIQVAFGSLKRITGPTISYQYDVQQILVINGLNLPEYYVVDFCNEGDATVIPMTGTSDGVEIPDSLLQTGKPVKAYIVVASGQGDVQTRYEVKLPVNNRPMRDDIHPTDPQQQQIDALVATLNDGVSRAETAAEAAEQAETEIETYVERAETAAGNAETSASNASSSATNAANSASTATTKASQAASSAQSASQDASAANTSAGSAAQSASSASASASAAAGSASSAASSANSASASAGQAATSATNASNSAGQAANSATAAGQSATNAAGSATTATTQAGIATTKAGEAAQSATAASGAQTAAETAQDKAEDAQEAAEAAQQAAEQAAQDVIDKAPVIINSASGDIASFPDGADDMPIKSLVAFIEPVQDLHGQDSPYPAGGGINIFDYDNPVLVTVEYGGAANNRYGHSYTAVGSYAINAFNPSGAYIGALVNYSDNTWSSIEYIVSGGTTSSAKLINIASGDTLYVFDIQAGSEETSASRLSTNKMQVAFSNTQPTEWHPYANICPISGHTGLTVMRTGKNLCNNSEFTDGYYDSNTGVYVSGPNWKASPMIKCKPNTQYSISGDGTISGSYSGYLCCYDASGNFLSSIRGGSTGVHITTPANCYKFAFYTSATYFSGTIQVEEGNEITAYEPFGTTIPITFQTTIYGGSDEVIGGALESTLKSVDMGTLDWFASGQNRFYAVLADTVNSTDNTTNFYCDRYASRAVISNGSAWINQQRIFVVDDSYATAADFKAAMSGAQLVYPLATPVEYTLDGHELTTLYGQNNIWTDVGEVSVDYPADTKLYIDNKIAEAIAAL